ncbi:MAG: hypothetical protein FJX33_12905 [Alphaproteobacteria bacterium]|nr:hypothetical protein [Alphaproteobacteria bacterium]
MTENRNMLSECPNCLAGFDVPKRLLRDRARPLRCGQCGTLFPMPKPPAPEPKSFSRNDSPPPPPAEEPRPAAPPTLAVEEAQSEPEPHRDSSPPEPVHGASPRGLRAAWAASITLLIGGGIATIINPEALADAWPPAARLFAPLGLM